MGFWFECPATNFLTFWTAATIAPPFLVPRKSHLVLFEVSLGVCSLLLSTAGVSFTLSDWLTALSGDHFSYLPPSVLGNPISFSSHLTWGKEKTIGKKKRGKTPPQKKKIDIWMKLELHVMLQDKWRKSDLAWPHALIYHSTVSTALTGVLCTSSLVISQTP